MISPYQLYDNECGRYTIRFERINGKLWVDISLYRNPKKGNVRVSNWIHKIRDGKVVPRQDYSFLPLGQDVQDYINRLISLKVFL